MSRSTGTTTTRQQAAAGAAAAATVIAASSSSAHRCPRCHRGGVTINRAHPVCKPCTTALATQARADQERDALCRWLSSRANAAGDPVDDSALTVHPYQPRAVRRAVAVARAEGLDWRHPPEPVRYDKRLAALLAPWRRSVV